ncbi:hypothetical protein ABIE26_004220 [Pedobacter africanus]|uniref:Uncharacterized protein n=1 Tax=Pedobacter africanus TaxID=151894 RepID=A0ACC6L265_9SPHI|nr:hypothetical protein [Pedobacter africanus]
MLRIARVSNLESERKISHKVSGKLLVSNQVPIFYIGDVV